MSSHKKIMLLYILLGSNLVAADPTAILTLPSAIQIAVKDNPNLAQIQARSIAMAAIPLQAGALPDPVISFNALNLPVDSFNTAQENMTQLQGGISQSIPFPGKLSLREETARYEAEAAVQNVTEARQQLRHQVKNNWWSLFYLDRALELTAANKNLLRQFVKIAQTKYEVGIGLQQDVLLAQLELSKILDNEFILEAAHRNIRSRLNVLLNNPANKPVSLPSTIDSHLPRLLSEDQLYQQAEDYRALLAAQRQTVNAAQSRLALAKKGYYPDFKVGAYYGGRDDTINGQQRADFLSLKLSMTVPIFAESKQSQAVKQRSSELMQQKYALQDEWNKVRGQISQAHNDFQRASNQVSLFKNGIIPQARQTVASMLSGYQVNKVDFLNLLRSQITLFNYETQYWKALTEANQALAQLTAVVGKEEIYE